MNRMKFLKGCSTISMCLAVSCAPLAVAGVIATAIRDVHVNTVMTAFVVVGGLGMMFSMITAFGSINMRRIQQSASTTLGSKFNSNLPWVS